MADNKTSLTLLLLMEVLADKSGDSHLDDDFWSEFGEFADDLGTRLSVTPTQAVLLSICLRKGPRNVDFDDIAHHLAISNIRALTYSDDIHALVRARYLKYRDASDEDSFDVPVEIVRALKNDQVPEKPRRTGLSAAELFDYMDGLFEDLRIEAILPDDLYRELQDLFAGNIDLTFVQALSSITFLNTTDWMVLVMLCHLLVNKDDDAIFYSQIEDVYPRRSLFYADKTKFLDGNHFLMRVGLVEHRCDDGMVNNTQIHLSDKAKSQLLADFRLHKGDASIAGLILPEKLTEKTLFYTAKNAPQVKELHDFLMPDRYNRIRDNMMALGFRTGFACLFHGFPGTGKTETAYQLARQTGRGIMAVNIPEIKSKWVGDSEKNIQEVFDRYRRVVEQSELAPILLFNEADGILGIRQEGAQHAVEKMENSIQNIILQEMEKLDGILIATTNLTQNLDSAFERRFLYKICFERPDASVREKIWHVMLPALTPEECAALASAYDLSGGQMENVARKFSINCILYGGRTPRMDTLRAYCDAERMDGGPVRKIGF